MTYKTRIETNNTELQSILETVNALPEAGGDTSVLPDEYQAVEYIASTGTQWIDTGYVPTVCTTVEAIAEVTSVPTTRNAWVFGARTSGASSRYEIVWIYGSNEYKFYYNSSIYVFSGVASTGSLDIHASSSNATVNDVTVTPTPAIISPANNLYIFSSSGGTAKNETIEMKLRSFKIYDGTALVRDFSPCYRISDNEVGLYDLVNDVFYTNAGTGVFTVA